VANVNRSSSDNIANATSLAFVVRNITNEMRFAAQEERSPKFHLDDFAFDNFISISLTNYYLSSR